ncbi:MAG: BatA and WFA domain-containing protein, partial [Clostridia bacterium]|nr:BatA and WFA domain-containing protein [Clostridia bacterium]
MRFYYPLGLLGLIGIPIIVIIYIIKSKYTEQVVPSTYLWELSEKFLKKRKPISKLTGIISLLLQVFAVLFVTVAIAHPVFTVPNSANDVYIILDGSASMNMQQGKLTRFEIAKTKVNEIIDDSHDGSTYSLVFAGESTDVVFEGVSNKQQAKLFVEGLSAGWTASDCKSALSVAQRYFDANRSALMYLVTDKQYEVNDALTLVDVSGEEQNYAFYRYGYDTDTNGVRGLGQVISYAADATIKVELWIAENAGEELQKVDETEVTAVKEEPTDFVLTSSIHQFAQLELRIVSSDAMQADNRVVLSDAATVQSRKVLFESYLISK